ncbi:spore coat U domain-containing protein [Zavarzinia compransoris]|uniref:Csu type fimbrial protein n=1 Tax=Zavarzinia marina TaxID=2911065 RepID=UPI001F24946B|nr:spore coat U domain-containing protein [Zavarzinia marina]MCF4165007.1 spore coat U domain-containing protein [Zavarzinia marina]
MPTEMRQTPRLAALLIAGALWAAPAGAADTSSTTVTMTVNANCIVTANDLAFGAYNPMAPGPTDGATTLQVRCTNTTAYAVKLNKGAGTGATVSQRRMSHAPSGTLVYSLYTDSGRGQVWGDDSGGASVSGVGTGLAQTLTVYGRIPAGQFSTAGSYTDTVSVTINY